MKSGRQRIKINENHVTRDAGHVRFVRGVLINRQRVSKDLRERERE